MFVKFFRGTIKHSLYSSKYTIFIMKKVTFCCFSYLVRAKSLMIITDPDPTFEFNTDPHPAKKFGAEQFRIRKTGQKKNTALYNYL